MWDEVISLIVAAVIIGVGGCIWCGERVTVVDDATDIVGVFDILACRLWNGAHPEAVGNTGLIGGDDDIVSLAHADIKYSGFVRRDGNQVGGDNLHGVVVDHELEVGIDSCVDEAHAVGFTGGEGRIVSVTAIVPSVGSVDKSVVKSGRSGGLCGRVQLVHGLNRSAGSSPSNEGIQSLTSWSQSFKKSMPRSSS